MTYQVIEEPRQFEGCWFSEYAEDSIIKPDWFKESDEHGILSACSPSRPMDSLLPPDEALNEVHRRMMDNALMSVNPLFMRPKITPDPYLTDSESWSLTDNTGVVWASDEERKAMWTHYCKPERTTIETAHGQPCNWCDKLS